MELGHAVAESSVAQLVRRIMSKALLALLMLASAATYDPPRALEWVGPQARAFGGKLKAALDPNRWLPGLSRVGRR